MKKAIIGVVIVSVIALLITGFFLYRSKGSKVKFKTEKVTRGDIRETVTTTGTINAITTVQVGTQVSGRIKNIYADFNSEVKKGQLLAQIDPAIYEAQVEQAKANLRSARANLEKANAALIDAKRTLDRASELFSESLVARSNLDTSETNYKIARAQASFAKAQIAQLSAALKFAETNLKYTDIFSPVDGVVISRNVNIGQTVVASFQSPILFIIAQDLTKMQIDTNVNEADIGRIRDGQEVEFTVDAYPETVFKGRVWQVRNAPIIVQAVVTYDVVITVDNPELKLRPGMTANASIIIAHKRGVLKIPNSALRFVPADAEAAKTLQKGYGVWIVENGKLKRISITIGISDDNYTELASGGIKEGNELVVGILEKTKGPESHRMF